MSVREFIISTCWSKCGQCLGDVFWSAHGETVSANLPPGILIFAHSCKKEQPRRVMRMMMTQSITRVQCYIGDAVAIVAKSEKCSTNSLLAQKISTKNT